MRCQNIKDSFAYFSSLSEIKLSEIATNLMGKKWFELKDPFGNLFKIIEDDYCFMKTDAPTGGVMGVTIGVSNLGLGKVIYQEGMQYNNIVAEETGKDLERIWLKPSNAQPSAFSQLLGPTQ